MSVLGRSAGTSGIEQLKVQFATTVTSADVGKVAYLDSASSEFVILGSIDINTIMDSLVGVISAVTVDGDGIGAPAQGFLLLKGALRKSGALVGQMFFAAAAGAITITPPEDGPAIRVGHSQLNGFLYVDIDPDSIRIAVLVNRMAALETKVSSTETLLNRIADAVLAAPVYEFAADEAWAANPEDTNTNFGLDDQWTEGTVGYIADFGSDEDWGVLTIT